MKNFFLSSLLLLVATFALSAQAPAEDLRIFPNPVQTQFEFGHSERVQKLRIINMVGNEVAAYDFKGEGAKYDVAELPAGMYLVQLKDAEGQVIHTQRIKKI